MTHNYRCGCDVTAVCLMCDITAVCMKVNAFARLEERYRNILTCRQEITSNIHLKSALYVIDLPTVIISFRLFVNSMKIAIKIIATIKSLAEN